MRGGRAAATIVGSEMQDRKKVGSSPLAGVRRVVGWFVILSFGALILAAVLVPRLSGATPYTILTGSMRPQLPPGTMVVTKPVNADKIAVGTVITYQLKSGERDVVTHRVVAVGFDGLGKRTFTTQGDANSVPDKMAVRPVQIKGELWYHIPYVGYATSFITGSQRHVATVTIAIGLLSYSALMFTSATRQRGKKKEKADV